MIDTSRTWPEMLEAIGARSVPHAMTPWAPTDPRCLTEPEASFRLVGASRDQLFPLLEVVLTQRFSGVPKSHLIRDLLGPVKNALGNAYKHGNGRDRSKSIHVETRFADGGVCIAITDEGAGFEVEATLARFAEDDHYYDNRGVGFHNFARSKACVSFDDGGRTWLLCYVSNKEPKQSIPPSPSPTRDVPSELQESLQTALLQSLQVESLTSLASEGTIRLFGPRPGEPGSYRCLLPAPRMDEMRLFTLQTFPSPEAARAEYVAARVMDECITGHRIRIPRPMALLERPAAVLYDYAPSMNLWTYLEDRGTPQTLEKMCRRLGTVLGAHHGAPLQVPTETWSGTLDRWARAATRARQCLQASSPAAAARLAAIESALLRLAAAAQKRIDDSTAPRDRAAFDRAVHGSLGWDCLQYGVDGRFYLSRFQHCRKAHPGLDLGGFLADLLLYCQHAPQPVPYRDGAEALLASYGDGNSSVWTADLPLFMTATLLERIPFLTARLAARAEEVALPTWISQTTPAALVELCDLALSLRHE